MLMLYFNSISLFRDEIFCLKFILFENKSLKLKKIDWIKNQKL